ncbi:S1 RNA-binding domain-containing protein [Amycolatopsis sp. Hca4]|uniref:S1 RNA-binding domain-containing protein n=1 Tax=Amycolatopsis sp. Hca4 TaxID=2742131 RepID=UPI0015908D34|nr:S1 RNA-binding domain-containing protein [Amycolatopsis sp. Hca4]QKV81533.1 S1 RNA-binding domain-containing protein [Amycolatopsis sp. Hca4]
MGGRAEHPQLWAFLEALHPGELLTGTVAAIERFGVFVALDDGPAHPVFPGVGFVVYPELSWRRFAAATDVVQVGARVSGEFLAFDTTNLEARLSLRATQPDPFQAFADTTTTGRQLRGRVTLLSPVGVFVEVADGVEGLVREPIGEIRVGDELTVVVTGMDRVGRKLTLAPGPPECSRA